MKPFTICTAHSEHLPYVDAVVQALAVPGIKVAQDLMSQPLYAQAFCVEEVNRLVQNGIPFRDAYRQVGKAVQEGTFQFAGELKHTHEGSIGNLCLSEIETRFRRLLEAFTPQKA